MTDHTDEDSLEPRHLIRRSDVVLRAGIMMLGAGTSGLRVREVMRAIASSLGIDGMSAQITYTDVVLTVERRGIFRTQVAEIGNPGVNAHRIAMLQAMAHDLPERSTVDEMERRLDRIERTKPLYPTWLLTILVALACASVCVLTNGGPREVLAILPASGIGYLLHRTLGRWQLNHLAVVCTSSAVTSTLFVLFSMLGDSLLGGPSPRMAAGFICSMIYLIPGFPLVTSGLDLGRIDLQAGIPRLAYALLVLLAMTLGVWLVTALTGVSADPVPALGGPPVVIWIARLAASFLAVFGWATMFNSPLRMAVASGAVAVVGNVPRLIMIDHGVANYIATFVGCFLMGLLCAVVARWFTMTKIIMTVPTVLVSIPGSSALRALLYFQSADVTLALTNLIVTLMIVIAMICGLSGARMLTDPEWALTRPELRNVRMARLRELMGFHRLRRRR